MFSKFKEEMKEYEEIALPPTQDIVHDLALRFIESDPELKYTVSDWLTAYQKAYKDFIFEANKREKRSKKK